MGIDVHDQICFLEFKEGREDDKDRETCRIKNKEKKSTYNYSSGFGDGVLSFKFE